MVRLMSNPPLRPDGRPHEAEQDEIARTVGARLRELRAEHGLSLRELERRSGVARSSISRLERGLRRPRPSLLGWLAYGLDPDRVEVLRKELCEAAGISLIAESRWSQRTHARHAWRAVLAGEMPIPAWLAGPWALAIFGTVMPEKRDMLAAAQKAAASGALDWPEGARSSPEVLALANEFGSASPYELARIGRAYLASQRAQAERHRRKRSRELRASLVLTGVPSMHPRPRRRRRNRAGS